MTHNLLVPCVYIFIKQRKWILTCFYLSKLGVKVVWQDVPSAKKCIFFIFVNYFSYLIELFASSTELSNLPWHALHSLRYNITTQHYSSNFLPYIHIYSRMKRSMFWLYFSKVYSQGSKWQWGNNDLGNDFVANIQQAITWTNDLDDWCYMSSVSFKISDAWYLMLISRMIALKEITI